MTITCPECHTRFSLDDSRIQGPTAKVRCSRCRHIFRVNKEGQVLAADLGPREPKAAAPVSPAAAPEAAPAPPMPGPEVLGPPPTGPTLPVAPPQPEPIPEAAPAPAKARRPWLWVSVLLLAVLLAGGLAWLAWTGHLPGLKGKQAPLSAPTAAPGPESKAPAPASMVATPPPPPAPTQDMTELAVDWAQAHYQGLVNNKGGGQLLLIQGEVINKGKTPRGPIRLKATLTDAQHHPLREELAFAGTTLSDNELKTQSPEEIKGWLTKPGGRSQEPMLKPGEKEPFAVVFFGVPDNLAETQSGFQLVVVEGPAAK